MKTVLINFYKTHKVICILLILCLILGFLSLVIRPKDYRLDKNKPLVYSKESYVYEETLKSSLPIINLSGEDASKINQELTSIYHDSKKLLTYHYQISGDYLSFVYCIISIAKAYPTYEVKTAVFDLTKKKQLKTEEILSIYNISQDEVRQKITDTMQKYYQDATKKGFIEANECDYNCFIKERQFSTTAPLYLAFEGQNLVAYQAFNIYGVYKDKEYFEDEDFRFEIVSKDSK